MVRLLSLWKPHFYEPEILVAPWAVYIRTPYRPDNAKWLEGIRYRKAPLRYLNRGIWELPSSCLDDLTEATLARYGSCFITRFVRVGSTARCDTRCVDAKGWVCTCSCGGSNHKGSTSGYRTIGETTLVKDIGEGHLITDRLKISGRTLQHS